MEWTDASTSTASASSSSNTCSRCGAFVTEQFTRVFGNNDDEVFGCLSCGTARDLREGKHLDA